MKFKLAMLLVIVLFTTSTPDFVFGAEPVLIEEVSHRDEKYERPSGRPLEVTYDNLMNGMSDSFEMQRWNGKGKFPAQWHGVEDHYLRSYDKMKSILTGRSPSDTLLQIIKSEKRIYAARMVVYLNKDAGDVYDLNVALMSRFLNNCAPGILDHPDWLTKAIRSHSSTYTLYDSTRIKFFRMSHILVVTVIRR